MVKVVISVVVGLIVGFLTCSICNNRGSPYTTDTTYNYLPINEIGDSLILTFYSPTKEECDDTPFIMANGERVFEGAIAISRDLLGKHLKMGDYVYIQQFGIFRVCDLMHPRKKKHLDIFFFNTKQVKRLGVFKVKAYKVVL